jgi:hypothetical protein
MTVVTFSDAVTPLSNTLTFAPSVEDWTSTVVNMCMGELAYIGVNPLYRYNSRSHATRRCDDFMQEHCKNDSTSEACACVEDEIALQAKSKKLGVNLPVMCFGRKCGHTRSYKTSEMKSSPCNLTVCLQTIEQSGNIVNDGQDRIYCGGRYYTPEGKASNVEASIAVETQKKKDSSSLFLWLVVGISAILFIVLIVLLFSPSPKSPKPILEQVKNLQSLS